MADAAALADPTDQLDDSPEEAFAYPVEVEHAGPATKKVKVTVPRDRIDAKTQDTIGELRSGAALPGFRPGKAPRHLVEKRFRKVLKDQVQQELLRESYQHALEKNGLSVLGEPDFENPESVKIPDSGDFVYSFTVEVQPDIHLPTMEGLVVRKPRIEIKDEHVQQAMQNLREQQGALMPVEDRGVQEKDYLIADVTVTRDGEPVAQQNDAQLIARPGRIAGVEITDFAERVNGMTVGEERSFDVTVPESHPNPQIAGKGVQVSLKLKEIKSLELAEIDAPFLESLGFENDQQLLDALREQMVERVDADVAGNMRRQAQDYLLANTQLELPKRLSERQADRVINRRAVNLLTRGVPREQVQANLEQIKQGADEEAVRELKLFFILGKIAEERGIDVDEEELNGQVAMLALNQGQRPETLRNKMQQDGSLANFYVQLREQKTLDAIVAEGKIEEFEPSAEETKQAVEGAGEGQAEDDESQDVT